MAAICMAPFGAIEAGHAPDDLHQLIQGLVLGDERPGPGLPGAVLDGGVVVHAQDHYRALRRHILQGGCGGNAVHGRHINIHQHHIGLQG